MHAKNVLGRAIVIIDEVGPGAYADDISSDLHPAKMAIIFLRLFKRYAAQVDDEMQRQEIHKQFDFIAGITTGKMGPGMAKGLKVTDVPLDPPAPPEAEEPERPVF